MTIEKQVNEKNMTILVGGRLDYEGASMLGQKIGDLSGIERLVIDMKSLAYIASAGLRVLLNTQKVMDGKQGSMILTNVGEQVLDTLDKAGFTKFLNIRNV